MPSFFGPNIKDILKGADGDVKVQLYPRLLQHKELLKQKASLGGKFRKQCVSYSPRAATSISEEEIFDPKDAKKYDDLVDDIVSEEANVTNSDTATTVSDFSHNGDSDTNEILSEIQELKQLVLEQYVVNHEEKILQIIELAKSNNDLAKINIELTNASNDLARINIELTNASNDLARINNHLAQINTICFRIICFSGGCAVLWIYHNVTVPWKNLVKSATDLAESITSLVKHCLHPPTFVSDCTLIRKCISR
jgi:hypothetical protein